MPIVFAKNAREFNIPNVTFTSRAAPAIGSTENSLWQFSMKPHAPVTIHQLTREEIIIAMSGSAVVTLGDQKHRITKGDTIIIPPFVDFGMANETEEVFEGIAVLPVGTQAIMGTEPPFTPPWAL
jgi:quercetin dioxygenase-like cupin family protein